MAKFFIDRPVFAWVIALFILLAGVLAIPNLPVSQYPQIAPPTIIVTSIYPGASAQTVDESVTSLIEQEMNGAENMLYIESQSQSDGQSTVNVTFRNGTNPELAAVDVQNRLKRIEARLPQAVVQQGVTITRARSNLLMFVNLISTTGEQSPVALGDYLARNVINEIKRIPGVGVAQLFGTERAMRIWVDPDKLLGYKLTPADVVTAIRAQNAQFSAGILGDLPAPSSQRIATSIIVTGQLATTEEFGNIVLRATPGGATVRIRDVGRVEVAGQSYGFAARLNGKDIAAVGVQLTPTANALETAKLVRAKMAELKKYFPPGVDYKIPYDTSLFIQISIEEVIKTLL
ncbi:MAG: efflux RND transporter permease subunit, partial [Oxalobacteraceae bacterium]|nr:efflux RND transporter permease subunit [Oxalobacteraceae bacterium]